MNQEFVCLFHHISLDLNNHYILIVILAQRVVVDLLIEISVKYFLLIFVFSYKTRFLNEFCKYRNWTVCRLLVSRYVAKCQTNCVFGSFCTKLSFSLKSQYDIFLASFCYFTFCLWWLQVWSTAAVLLLNAIQTRLWKNLPEETKLWNLFWIKTSIEKLQNVIYVWVFFLSNPCFSYTGWFIVILKLLLFVFYYCTGSTWQTLWFKVWHIELWSSLL